jgi:hypothetical protein
MIGIGKSIRNPLHSPSLAAKSFTAAMAPNAMAAVFMCSVVPFVMALDVWDDAYLLANRGHRKAIAQRDGARDITCGILMLRKGCVAFRHATVRQWTPNTSHSAGDVEPY